MSQLVVGSVFVTAAVVLASVAAFEFGVEDLSPGPVLAVTGVSGIVVAVAGHREFHGVVGDTATAPDLQWTDAGDAVAVTVAGPVTYALSVDLGLGAIVASALVGLVAALAVPEYGAPAYCGSFVGMVSTAVFPSPLAVAGASLVAAAAYVLSKGVFDGFGGKLGTTAFVGCAAVVLPSQYTYAPSTFVPADVAAGAIVAAAGSAVGAFVLSVRLDWGAVAGSAVVGLVAGLLLPLLGTAAAAAAFAGSFAGMCSPDRLSDTGSIAGAGVLTGLFYVGSAAYFTGSGGKLGAVAFTGCLAASTLSGVVRRLRSRSPLAVERQSG